MFASCMDKLRASRQVSSDRSVANSFIALLNWAMIFPLIVTLLIYGLGKLIDLVGASKTFAFEPVYHVYNYRLGLESNKTCLF